MTGETTSHVGGFEMGLFGPRKDEAWRKISQEIGADFIEGGYWKGHKVRVLAKPWTITLDRCTSQDEGQTWKTRIRAPFVNPEGIRFTITRRSRLSVLGKVFGIRNIELDDPEFDTAFYLQGNDASKIRELFDSPLVRQMIEAQPQIHLTVKDNEGWFGPKFREDTDELYFEEEGVITDPDRLKGLFDLFAAILDQLCRIGSATKREPDVTL